MEGCMDGWRPGWREDGWVEGGKQRRKREGWERGKKEEMKVAGIHGWKNGATRMGGCMQEWTGSPAVLPMWTLGESPLLSEPALLTWKTASPSPGCVQPRPSHSPRAHRCP